MAAADDTNITRGEEKLGKKSGREDNLLGASVVAISKIKIEQREKTRIKKQVLTWC